MKPEISQHELNAYIRQDFYAFIERSFLELNPQTEFLGNWHIETIAAELEKCRAGETTRLIINVPPRSLKSHCASIAFVAWLLGQDPSCQVICASYAQSLADNLAMDCRTLMNSDFYQSLFPTRLSPMRKALDDFATTKKGFRLSTSVGGALTGRGANYIIIDDPLKPDEALSDTQRQNANDWFDHTVFSRLNDKRTGSIIIIMQRLHEDDLIGHVLAQDPSWKRLCFPAIAQEDESHVIETPFDTQTVKRKAGEALHPEREPLEVLQKIRETLGEYNFASQFLQSPAPPGGGMIKAGWFKTYKHNELLASFDLVFQSWDTANKATELSDYSVCTTWGLKDKTLYLINVFRKRLEFPDLKRAVGSQALEFSATIVLIEDKASGTQLIQELLHEGVHGIQGYEPKLEKVLRLNTVTSTIENGFVYLPEKAEWLDLYIHELTTFPNGKHDDQTDSTSQALDWVKQTYLGRGMALYHWLMEKSEKEQLGKE